MPTYEYRCDAFGHRFDLKQSFSSEPVADCPECGSKAKRVFHPVPVVFKGSGFYVNDYGKGNGAATARSDSEESKSKDKPKSSEKKSDSSKKSDSKKETSSSK